jgi:hypothetical protein
MLDNLIPFSPQDLDALRQRAIGLASMKKVDDALGAARRWADADMTGVAAPGPTHRSGTLLPVSGGIASIIAGLVIGQDGSGDLQNFDRLGYIVVATTLLSLGLMYFLQRAVAEASRR